MRVNDGVDVGAFLIDAHVHLDFGGGIELSLDFFALRIDLDNHVGRKRALGNARGHDRFP